MMRYINPFTDFGFKKLFGEESNKELLIDFLNELLHSNITQLTFLKTENLGTTEADRKAVFDLYCQNEHGEKFIVELQKAKQDYFKDRTLYYSTFAIQEQALKGDWNYQLQAVYVISIMDFTFDEWVEDKDKFRHDVQLVEVDTHRPFYDKLRFVYLEMPKFNKTIHELETHYDKWLYVLRNLPEFDAIPELLRETVFLKLFEVAEIARYDRQQQLAYRDSLKYYWDWKSVMDTAISDALLEVAKNAILAGTTDEFIVQITGLALAKVQKVRAYLSEA